MNNNNKFLETSLINLRNSMTEFTMDQFIVSTIESLMSVERNEYLSKLSSTDKGNGYYHRAFKALTKNS